MLFHCPLIRDEGSPFLSLSLSLSFSWPCHSLGACCPREAFRIALDSDYFVRMVLYEVSVKHLGVYVYAENLGNLLTKQTGRDGSCICCSWIPLHFQLPCAGWLYFLPKFLLSTAIDDGRLCSSFHSLSLKETVL